MAARVRILLCTALTVERAGRRLSGREIGSRKARTLLALLAAERGRPVPLDRVVDALWPATAPSDPAANVATLVSRTRRVLGEDVVTGQGRAYGIDPAVCAIDLDEAADLLDEARHRAAAAQPALAAAAARRALDLLGTSVALPDEPDEGWVVRVRREADDLRRQARHLLARSVAGTVPAEAAAVAAEAVAADPYDELAVRELIRALVAQGSVGAALSAYDDLATRLDEDLGTRPSAATSDLHLAVLREEPLPAEGATARAEVRRPTPVGRESELALIEGSWTGAVAGTGGLVLVDGVGGIGKTWLLDATAALAEATGARVLRGRCHPAERSLFLQPFIDALRPTLLGPDVGDPAALLGEHAEPWVGLLPELGAVLTAPGAAAGAARVPPHAPPHAPPSTRSSAGWSAGPSAGPATGPAAPPAATSALLRRRSYDAVAALLHRLALRRPVLLAVDDLQDAGAATVDLLGFLAGRVADEPVLLVGAVRSEDEATIGRLSDRATRLTLGALSAGAVQSLAVVAGVAPRAEEVMRRTAGHALSVVESLRSLASGDAGVPASLAAAVEARVSRLGPDARDLVLGACVLRGRLDPRLLAGILGRDEIDTVRRCEDVVRAGLMHRVGARYEFANDLTQECLLQSLPPALAVAHHRRAADLLGDRPEAMAWHAEAAGEAERAAQGWLLAGREAMDRTAVEDALALFGRAVAAASDPSLRARALLARARAHEAATDWEPALRDIDEALELAHRTADRRLEMAALRSRGGDVPVALRRPMAELGRHLEAGLRLATGLGDRRAEADFITRLTVIDASRLRLGPALDRARASLARARTSSAAKEAVPLALDGVKTVLSYLGATDPLREVVTELVPLLRERGSLWMLQWAVFESSYVAASEGDWVGAQDLVREALELNRRSGFGAYAGYFRAHLGWYLRLTGDLDGALALGGASVQQTSPVDHPWWYAAASGLLAGTLLEVGREDEAGELARRGLDAATEAPEAWRLRCLAPLAAASKEPSGNEAFTEGCRLLERIDCPPGSAWVIGADCYLLLARAAHRRGRDEEAARLLAPLQVAVGERWAAVRTLVEAELAQITSATS